MKKFFFLFILLFIGIINITAWASDEGAKSALGKDVEKYCRYNASGEENGKYDVIVAIGKDNQYAYADTKEAGEEPILNYRNGDDDFNDFAKELENSYNYTVYNYYLKNKKCPPFALEVDRAILGYEYYLIEYKHYGGLKKIYEEEAFVGHKFKIFILSENGIDNSLYKECKYEYEVYESSNDKKDDKKTKLSIILKYDKTGHLLNETEIKELNQKIEISSELIMGHITSEMYDVCPSIYSCSIGNYVSNEIGTGTTFYNQRLYYSDMTMDGLKEEDCQKVNCVNTDSKFCQPGSFSSNYCESYFQLKRDYDTKLQEIKNCEEKANCSVSSYNDYNRSMYILKQYCSSVMANLNSTNPCLIRCLEFSRELQNNDYYNDSNTCGFSGRLILFVGNIIKWCKYIVPVIAIVLSILDFIKAIGAGKEDEMKKAQGKFIKRLIVAGLVFIMPFIIEFVLNKMGFEANGCGIIDL